MKKVFLAVILALMVFGLTCGAYAAGKVTPDEQVLIDAKDVFGQINNSIDMGIPRGLVYTAQAIAIFPKCKGGGFIVGAMGGRGVILYKNQKDKWSTPAYLRLSEGSFGFQVGVQEVDIVLVFMDKTSADGLLNSKIKLGVDAGVAAGPVGRNATIGADIQAKSIIYSYSRARGAFIGLKLDGTVISQDETADKAVYGKDLSTDDIIMKGKAKTTPAGKELIKVIAEYTKK